ncbi:MAG: hypothetical protein L0271_26650 [Gemmatimonadetes bacterium]|nr:hypothetical protein [Gemmatimonadota bacterium]
MTGELRSQVASDDYDIDRLQRVRSLCRDAMGVLPDFHHYLQEKERVQRFRAGIQSDDQERRRVISSYIRDTLGTSHR